MASQLVKPESFAQKKAFEGIIYKGVGKDYNFTNLEEYLVNGGKIPNLKSELNTEVLISEYLANDYN